METSYDMLGTFRDLILGAAQSVLPYLGVGVAGGVVVLAVVWGIRKAVTFARGIGEDSSGYVEKGGHLFYNGVDLGDPYDYDSEAYEHDRRMDDEYDKAN